MTITDWEGLSNGKHKICGGEGTTVKIQIDNKCTTKAKLYPKGKTVSWTSEDLKDCATNKILNPNRDQFSFQIIRTDKTIEYCINEVTVVLDDQISTTYTKITHNDFRQKDDIITVPMSGRQRFYGGSLD